MEQRRGAAAMRAEEGKSPGSFPQSGVKNRGVSGEEWSGEVGEGRGGAGLPVGSGTG